MKIFFHLSVICLTLSYLDNYGQNTEAIYPFIEQSSDQSIEDLNESGQTEIPDDLQQLVKKSLNLNEDNLDILLRYQLLTEKQAIAIKNYIRTMGQLVNMEELQQIEELDKKTIIGIMPYSSVNGNKSEDRSGQLTLRLQKNLDKQIENEDGSGMKLLLKFKLRISQQLSFSFTGETDAGETMLTRKRHGFDFNSLNVLYRGKGLIDKILLGDYVIEYGQGLCAWYGLSLGGGNNIAGIYKSGRGLIPYSGTDENRFLRGLAVSLKQKKSKVDIWLSNHAVDANVFRDSASNQSYVLSLLTSGYHRTFSETQDFHSVNELSLGLSYNYTSDNFKSGIVAGIKKYNIPLIKKEIPYTRFNFSGQIKRNLSWYYTWIYQNLTFFGENSYNPENSFALLNGLILSADPKFSFCITYRNYGVAYTALNPNASGVNTSNANETGFNLGMNYKVFKKLTYSVLLDFYTFPFLKYRVDKPSHGFDFIHDLDYSPNKKFNAKFRYRRKLKEENTDSEKSPFNLIDEKYSNSFRASIRFKIGSTWEYALRSEFQYHNNNFNFKSQSSIISQSIHFNPMGKGIGANARYAVFNCRNFNDRIYEYENDVQGSFAVPFYYGLGSRFYVNINTKLNKNINLSMRYSKSWFDQSDASKKTTSDIKIQLIVHFR